MAQQRERQPIHPGEILAEDVLVELDMSAAHLAAELDVPANRITEILRGRRGISADTALRLGRWLGASPKFWLDLQQAYDLEVAEEMSGEDIRKAVTPREPALAR